MRIYGLMKSQFWGNLQSKSVVVFFPFDFFWKKTKYPGTVPGLIYHDGFIIKY